MTAYFGSDAMIKLVEDWMNDDEERFNEKLKKLAKQKPDEKPSKEE